MRITLVLDADVERILRDVMRERGVSFKEALNLTVRAGAGKEARFRQQMFSMGAVRHFLCSDAIEDEELVRRLSLDNDARRARLER